MKSIIKLGYPTFFTLMWLGLNSCTPDGVKSDDLMQELNYLKYDTMEEVDKEGSFQELSFTIEVCGEPPSTTQLGTFQMTIGDFQTAGNVVTDISFIGPDPQNPNVIFSTNDFEDEHGSFRVKIVMLDNRASEFNFPVVDVVKGNFIILEGSDHYIDILGQGKLNGTLTVIPGFECSNAQTPQAFHFLGEYTGKVRL